MASQSNRSLDILNTTQKGTGIFPQFPKLPPELRSRIWEQSLCQERMVRVHLTPRSSLKDKDEGGRRSRSLKERRAMRQAQRWGEFLIVLSNYHEISKLFSVCSESRQAARRFYRVQLPCRYEQWHSPSTKGVFYFHPELDTLDIIGQEYLPRFAHMLWEHDHRRVGLVNLALLHGRLRTTFDKLFTTADEELARHFLSRLRRVYLGYKGHLGRSVPVLKTGCKSFTASTILRSRPLLASVSGFQRLQQDPRAVEAELKKIYMGTGDPRDQIYRWFRLLDHWKIEYPHHTVDYRFLVTINDRRVSTKEDALRSVRRGEGRWEEWKKECEKNDVAVEDAGTALPTAYGFWLFPITAFGPIPEASNNIRHMGLSRLRDIQRFAPYVWNTQRAVDLSEFKPELCLQSLPEATTPKDDEENLQDDSEGSLTSDLSANVPRHGRVSVHD